MVEGAQKTILSALAAVGQRNIMEAFHTKSLAKDEVALSMELKKIRKWLGKYKVRPRMLKPALAKAFEAALEV